MADNQIYFRNRGLFNLITLFFFFLFFLDRFRFLGFFEDVELFNGCMYFNQRKSFRRASSGSAKNKGLSSPSGLLMKTMSVTFRLSIMIRMLELLAGINTSLFSFGGINANDVSFIIGEVDGFPITVHVHHVEFVIPEITGHISPFVWSYISVSSLRETMKALVFR